MKKLLSIAYSMMIFVVATAGNKDSLRGAGDFSLGMRNNISAFTDAGSMGMGAGGEFRIRLGKRLNTEWFADYISTNVQGLGYRHDAHIGWSVLFYLDKNPLTVGKITPYVLAGHCFDYTRVYSMWYGVYPAQRWSSAVQGGAGIHYNLTSRFDISLLAQYMIHLGNNVEANVVTDESSGQKYLDVVTGKGTSADGHLLVTLSVNYCLGHLWGGKK